MGKPPVNDAERLRGGELLGLLIIVAGLLACLAVGALVILVVYG